MSKLVIAALFCVGTTMILAQQHPDFSGTWKLNLGASDFRDPGAYKPDSMVLTIQQHADSLRYRLEKERSGRKDGFNLDLSIGGKARSKGGESATAAWKNSKLEIRIVYKPGEDNHSDEVETWTMSPDGMRLTDDLVSHSPDVHVVRVFDKQR